jgi:hypothetical protein
VKLENERQLKTYVLVKQEGKWLLTHDQNTIIANKSVNPDTITFVSGSLKLRGLLWKPGGRGGGLW